MTSSTPHINSCIKFLLAIALCVLVPHTAYGGAWTLQKGQMWSKLNLLTQSTSEHYLENGDVGEFPATYKSNQLFLDVFYGVNDRVDIGIQIPYCGNKFVDIASVVGLPEENAKESGIGDLRGYTKINLVQQAIVATLKLGFKAPIGEYRPAPEAISVSEGQWDFDIIFQIGGSLYPAPMYANIDLGFRLRQENETGYDPPEELIYNAEIGYSLTDKFLLALKLEGLRGDDRRTTYVVPTVLIGLNQNLSIETSLRRAVSGRKAFAGNTWAVGISYQK